MVICLFVNERRLLRDCSVWTSRSIGFYCRCYGAWNGIQLFCFSMMKGILKPYALRVGIGTTEPDDLLNHEFFVDERVG